jgi:hypothetical protein
MNEIVLPVYEQAGQLTNDVAGQFLLEADARKRGMKIEREFLDGAVHYRFRVGVPGQAEERKVKVGFPPDRANPVVHADGPPCLRHRWGDDSLCMWDPNAPAAERWLVRDGIPSLAEHVGIHLFCEAECRAGRPWPKTEMAGDHPRKSKCPTCRGQGR